VYERAFKNLRDSQPDAKEEALMLLEAWRTFEQGVQSGDEAQREAGVQAVEKRLPKRIKRKRPIETEEGLDAGMEVS
jgi:crooked neck